MTSPPVTLPLATAVLATALAEPATRVTLPPLLTTLPLSVRLPVVVETFTAPVALTAPKPKAWLPTTVKLPVALADKLPTLVTATVPLKTLALAVSVALPVPATMVVLPVTFNDVPAN